MKRIALVLVALSLAACGGEEHCEHEVESKEGVSLCMPTDTSKMLCVVEPDVPDSPVCIDCGSLARLGYFFPSSSGPKLEVCLCTERKNVDGNCNKVMPKRALYE